MIQTQMSHIKICRDPYTGWFSSQQRVGFFMTPPKEKPKQPVAPFIAPADQTANFRNWKNSIVVKIASTSVFADVFQCFFCFFFWGGERWTELGPFFNGRKSMGGFFIPPLWMAKELMIGRCNFLLVGPSFKGENVSFREGSSKCRSERVHRIAVWKELEYPWFFSFSWGGGGDICFFSQCLILTLPTRREKQHRPDQIITVHHWFQHFSSRFFSVARGISKMSLVSKMVILHLHDCRRKSTNLYAEDAIAIPPLISLILSSYKHLQGWLYIYKFNSIKFIFQNSKTCRYYSLAYQDIFTQARTYDPPFNTACRPPHLLRWHTRGPVGSQQKQRNWSPTKENMEFPGNSTWI